MDLDLEGWPGSVRNRNRLAQRRQYISLYQRKLQLARQQQASGQKLGSDEQVRLAGCIAAASVSRLPASPRYNLVCLWLKMFHHVMQARMKVESDAIAELESRFTAEDAELFRMFAERTLPELPPNAAGGDSADETRSAARESDKTSCGDAMKFVSLHAHDSCVALQSAWLDAVGRVHCGGLPWLLAAPGSAEPGGSSQPNDACLFFRCS